MKRELFDAVFKQDMIPFIHEIEDNNPRIKAKDVLVQQDKIYREYQRLRSDYKDRIFDKADVELLDRHKVASCMCGAVLANPVFDITPMVEQIKKERTRVEARFFYENELVAYHCATRCLAAYIVADHIKDEVLSQRIAREFPQVPNTLTSKSGFLKDVLFDLSQIKDQNQIGIEHYDKYSYALFFFWLERYYLDHCL